MRGGTCREPKSIANFFESCNIPRAFISIANKSFKSQRRICTMPLFILTETSAGYALLKAQDKKLLKHDDLAHQLESAEDACSQCVEVAPLKIGKDCTDWTLAGSN